MASLATLCSASGLVPPYVVDEAAAEQVAGLVQPRMVLGNAPKAMLLLHLAGVAPDSGSVQEIKKAWGAGHTLQLDVQDSSPASLLQSAGDLVAANPTTAVSVLDHTALQGCGGGSCLLAHLASAMHDCGGRHHASTPAAPAAGPAAHPLSGRLELPGSEQHLDLATPAARLFALELAGLQGSAQQLLERLKQQSAEEQDQVLAVYEGTFVGLQALAAALPAGSQQLAAAEAALGRLLSGLVGQLREVYGTDIMFQVALLGDAPVSPPTATHLLDWKQAARRVLLHNASPVAAASGDAAAALRDDAADGKAYAQKATAYGVTLLLIWFAFAGTYCMVAMPFKHDSLLYGRAKAD